MAVAGTSFDRSFPLELDAQHRSAFAKAGDRNGQPYVFKIKGWPFWWWMRNASDVSLRAVSEADSPGVLRLLWSAAESRRTCLRVNEVPLPSEGRFGADARAPIITFSVFTQNNPFPKDFSKERGV